MRIKTLKKNIEREIQNAETSNSVKDLSIHYKQIHTLCEKYLIENPHQRPEIETLKESSLAVLSQISAPIISNIFSQSYTQTNKNKIHNQ